MSAIKQRSIGGLGVGVLLAAAMNIGSASAADAHAMHDHSHHDHSAHQAMLQQTSFVRSTADYAIPDVALVDANGKAFSLRKAIEGDKPVLLNFIFTTCTTICPVMSANFTKVQSELAAERGRFLMISISIDPDYDTPAKLKEYAARHGAGPDWHMLTGNREEVLKVARAFDAWRGDKMNHSLITFLHAGAKQPWVRLDGLATPADLVGEYRSLAKAPVAAQGS